MSFDFGNLTPENGADVAHLQQRMETMYRELKVLARRQLARSSSATLNTTGLVHEMYLKMAGSDGVEGISQHHFFALAAKAMRQIVIDLARAGSAAKRGGKERQHITLDRVADDAAADTDSPDVIKLNDALEALQDRRPDLAELVELRFFAGLTMEQIAELREVSPRTLDRDWRRARTYLFTAMHDAG